MSVKETGSRSTRQAGKPACKERAIAARDRLHKGRSIHQHQARNDDRGCSDPAGTPHPLHSSHFDLHEGVIGIGSKYLALAALDWHGSQQHRFSRP